MSLSVERAGVLLRLRSRHHGVRAEVDVLCQLDVERGLAIFHAFAERLPVGLRADADFVALCPRRRGQHEGKQEEA